MAERADQWWAAAERAQACRNCGLWEHATQVVFGEGPVPAEVMLVGEQPGDREDVDGRPFVGPAGGVLANAVERAGWRRQDLYVTNAVKHFKWTPRGKRRLHQTPDRTEVQACRPWLDEELALVKPRLLVLLGATAVKSQLSFATDPGGSSGLMDAWWQAIEASPTTHRLRSRPRTTYLDYLSRPNETWARSYAQWVATRSGDTTLLTEIEAIQQAGTDRALSQWTAQEFAPIADTIDEIFRQIGLAK